jgi:hypothetical protein
MSNNQEGYFMRTRAILTFFAGIMFITLMGYSQESSARVSVNIGIGVPALPQVVIHQPPPVVVIPGTYVYFAPDVGVDMFFYHGYWYRPQYGHWYRARGYNGPWDNIRSSIVPYGVRHLPPDFHNRVRHQERIRHVDLQRNWKTWERRKHWDRQDYRHEARDVHDRGRLENNHRRPDYKHDVKQVRDAENRKDNRSKLEGRDKHER